MTSSTKAAKPTAKTRAKSADNAAAAPTEKLAVKKAIGKPTTTPAIDTDPSLRFYHSKALRTRTDKVLSAIEIKPDASGHGAALADLVNDLIDAGLDYYFLRPLKQAEVGFVAEQSARLGLSGAVRLISSVSRKYIVRMEPQQLQVVASHIRALT